MVRSTPGPAQGGGDVRVSSELRMPARSGVPGSSRPRAVRHLESRTLPPTPPATLTTRISSRAARARLPDETRGAIMEWEREGRRPSPGPARQVPPAPAPAPAPVRPPPPPARSPLHMAAPPTVSRSRGPGDGPPLSDSPLLVPSHRSLPFRPLAIRPTPPPTPRQPPFPPAYRIRPSPGRGLRMPLGIHAYGVAPHLPEQGIRPASMARDR